MKKDSRIIIVICIVFLALSAFLFIKQQNLTSNVSNELVKAETANKGHIEQTKTDISSQKKCAVYISGAVKKPGLYRYNGTARISDAIHAVGGFQKSAAKDAINLARVLKDGEHIIVYTKKQIQKKKKQSRNVPNNTTNSDNNLININTATQQDLIKLPGIGEAKANLILSFRSKQGSFQKKEDLMKIQGIKQGIYNKIKDLIMI